MADPLNRVVSSDDLQSLTARGMSDVETFWTDAEMARAEPVEMRFPEPPIQPLKKALWQQPGPLTTMESQAPDDGVLDNFLESLPLGDGFSTAPVQDRTVLPYKTVGKMFMQFDGANSVGTGWVISERAVFTAGHCVYDKNSQGSWADRILFVPQYHNGQAPVSAAGPPSVSGRWTGGAANTITNTISPFFWSTVRSAPALAPSAGSRTRRPIRVPIPPLATPPHRCPGIISTVPRCGSHAANISTATIRSRCTTI